MNDETKTPQELLKEVILGEAGLPYEGENKVIVDGMMHGLGMGYLSERGLTPEQIAENYSYDDIAKIGAIAVRGAIYNSNRFSLCCTGTEELFKKEEEIEKKIDGIKGNNDNPDASESPNAGLGSLRGYFSERGAGYSGNNDDEEESGPAPNPRDEDIPDDNNDDSREEETGPPANGIDKAKDPTQGYDGSTDPRNGGDGDGGDSSSSSSSSSSSGHKPGDQHPPDSGGGNDDEIWPMAA